MFLFARLICLVVLVSVVFAARSEAASKVLFDVGHGERFLIGEKGPLQLSGLAEIFGGSGIQATNLEKPISDESLAEADGLVISGAFAPLSQEEVDALLRFMERGGRLAVMLHIAPPLSSLLARIGIMYTNGVILEHENVVKGNPQQFRVSRLDTHPVFEGITGFNMYGVWGIVNADERGKVIASTGPHAWIDLHRNGVRSADETGAFGVVCAGDMGEGGFLIFGDDALFQNKYLDKDNRELAVNLAGWLNRGKVGEAPDKPPKLIKL